MSYLKGKSVLITGVCGSVGKEIARFILGSSEHKPGRLVGIDNNESELFFLSQELEDDSRVELFLGDLRDRDALSQWMRGVDIVFHAAAFKHVILCEKAPFEAVQTNIIGVQNIILAAIENDIEKVVFTSSDKAVNPTNVMGTSKLMGERLITAANINNQKSNTIFASTRFGNVLGSNGSVIPIFKSQIEGGGPVTLTDPGMTRFVMSMREAAELVVDSAEIAKGGEVFITKMPVIRIENLAKVMIQSLSAKSGFRPEDIDLSVIGQKAGEKLYEELMSLEETRRAIELKRYFVIPPAFSSIYKAIDYSYRDVVSKDVSNPYISSEEDSLSDDNIEYLLKKVGVIN